MVLVETGLVLTDVVLPDGTAIACRLRGEGRRLCHYMKAITTTTKIQTQKSKMSTAKGTMMLLSTGVTKSDLWMSNPKSERRSSDTLILDFRTRIVGTWGMTERAKAKSGHRRPPKLHWPLLIHS